MKTKKFIIAMLFLNIYYCYTNEIENPDSVKIYKLGTIIEVTAPEFKTILPTTIHNISYPQIIKTDAVSMKNLTQIIPAAQTQTNSRGEAMLFIRGVGDRRLGLYLDGIPLNEPWDRRFNLSMIPTDVIGNMSIQNGSASILFGSNSMAGAMDVTTIEKKEQGFGSSFRAIGGTAQTMNYSLTGDGKIGQFNMITNISYYSTNGQILSKETYNSANSTGDTTMINQRDGSFIRTNTDMERMNFLIRGEYDFTTAKVGLSYIRIQGNYGIAPQGFDISKPRFWRYPNYDRNIIGLHYTKYFNSDESHNIKAVAWYDGFAQKIDEFKDIEYKEKISMTKDQLGSMGARLSYNFKPKDNHWLTAMFSIYNAQNKESIDDLKGNMTEFDYEETVYDLGVEYRVKLMNKLTISAGLLYSGQIIPKAGEFSSQNNTKNSDFGGVFGAKYMISDEQSFFINASKKMSYPALREAYANPPKKFEPNPELGPETGILSEIGYSIKKSFWEISPVFFINHYSDMIEQIKVKVDGISKNQRVNYSEAIFVGIEASFEVVPMDNLKIYGSVTYINASTKKKDNDKWGHLYYVPENMGNMNISYKLPLNIKLQFEIDYCGKQYDDFYDSEITPTLLYNLRISYNPSSKYIGSEIFLRCNNITDIERITTIGLPEIGRAIYGGFSINL